MASLMDSMVLSPEYPAVVPWETSPGDIVLIERTVRVPVRIPIVDPAEVAAKEAQRAEREAELLARPRKRLEKIFVCNLSTNMGLSLNPSSLVVTDLKKTADGKPQQANSLGYLWAVVSKNMVACLSRLLLNYLPRKSRSRRMI